MSLFEAADDPQPTYPTEPAFLVPVIVRDVPRLGPGQKGVFALQAIAANTKFWAWTDRVERIHHKELDGYLSRNFGKEGGEGQLDLDAVRLFLRQGFVLPRPSQPGAEEGDGDHPDDYFYSNPTDAGRFMNHSNHPNCGPDGTLRDVEAGEELTMDYGFHGDPRWYRDVCAKYGVRTEAQVAAECGGD